MFQRSDRWPRVIPERENTDPKENAENRSVWGWLSSVGPTTVCMVSRSVDKFPATEPISRRRGRKNHGTRFHLAEGELRTVSLPRSTGIRGHEHRREKKKKRKKKKEKKWKKNRTGSVPLYRKRMQGKRGGARGAARGQTYDVVLRFVKIPAFQILERVPLAKHLFNLCSPSCPPLFARLSSIVCHQPPLGSNPSPTAG